MASTNRTPHFALSQWVGTDNFVRTDFNADNAKIDAGMAAISATAQRALEGLVPVSYNVYNLVLQNYYERKKTGFKRALILDGFLDNTQVESLTTGLMWDAGNRLLLLDAVGQQEATYAYSWGYSDSIQPGASLGQNWTATGSGILTTASFYITGTARVTISQGGVIQGVQTVTEGVAPVTLPFSVPVKAGLTYALLVTNTGTTRMGFATPGASSGLGYKLTFQPTFATSGTMVSTSYPLDGVSGQARGWVRHSGGSVALALKSGGVWRNLTTGASRNTVNLDGAACMETSFALPQTISGPVQVRLAMSTTVGQSVKIYDYGIILV